MTALITLFAISCVGVATMLTLKVRELQTGRGFLPEEFQAQFETELKERVAVAKRLAFRFRIDQRRMLIALYVTTHLFARMLDGAKNKVDDRLWKLLNLIKGKRMVKRKGMAMSAFLRDMSVYKKNVFQDVK